MCGIWGCSLKANADQRAALLKLRILGLYNIQRGKDASGIFVNREITKKTEEFDDFIEKDIFPTYLIDGVVLGHNRQGSFQYKKTIEEAHPFLINENLVFTHNGSLEEIWRLCKKYNIEEKDYNVDSVLLGTLLATNGTKVLEDYRGAAALAYAHLDDFETLYLYHGNTKKYSSGPLIEERPLFFMETEEGLYYSSLESSLKAIRENESEVPKNLAYNTVFKIKNGEFLLDEAVEINREEANVTVYSPPATTNYYYPSETNSRRNRSYTPPTNIDIHLIFRESLPWKICEKKDSISVIYFHQGRYYIFPHELAQGPLFIQKNGVICEYTDNSAETLFFWKGVLLKDREAYYELNSKFNNFELTESWITHPREHNFACEISKYAAQPVYSLPNEYNLTLSEYYRTRWYKNKSEVFTDSYNPKFGSGRCYLIKGGLLTDIRTSHPAKDKPIMENRSQAYDQIVKLKNPLTQGGSQALIIPFPFKEKTKILPFWFFEKTYKTIDELTKDWTSDEFQAFYEYIGEISIRDYSTKLFQSEITEHANDIIDICIKKEMSVGEYIENSLYGGKPGDTDMLLKIHDEILSRKDVVPTIISNLSKSTDIVDLVDEDEEDETEADIESVVEDCIISLEDIQAQCSILVNTHYDSDFAQECAKPLMTGIDNILANIGEPLDKFKKKELEERVDKIRETKIIQYGIL